MTTLEAHNHNIASHYTKDGSWILIVDDDPIVRSTLEELLAKEGYNLVLAPDGHEALSMARALTFDLILLDVIMPGMDGFQVCRDLRADNVKVPIIMLTGLGDRESRLTGIEAGADDFIAKPFDWAELRARVRTVTELSRHRRLRTLELEAERDRTRSILEALGEAVVVTDLDGKIEFINPATTALTGYSSEEAIGQSWRIWQTDSAGHGFDQAARETVLHGGTWRGEIVGRHRDGTTYDAILTVAPLSDPKACSRPMGLVSVQQDITPLKEAERLKDRFVSNVTHELSTPLSVLTLVADNLDALYGRLDDQRRHKMIRDIQRHVQVLNDLVEDILQVSRLDNQSNLPEKQWVDLVRLTAEEIERQQPLALGKRLDLLLSSTRELDVPGNEGQLRRVISNLISNAIKYSRQGGHIACECAPVQGGCVDDSWPGLREIDPHQWAGFRVVDTGIGIAPQDLPHVFERFFRVRDQSNVRGTGLGLSIARELVERHSGHIFVTSVPGQGSVFAFYLPME
jgi:PAS domain S-box-containing protein